MHHWFRPIHISNTCLFERNGMLILLLQFIYSSEGMTLSVKTHFTGWMAQQLQTAIQTLTRLKSTEVLMMQCSWMIPSTGNGAISSRMIRSHFYAKEIYHKCNDLNILKSSVFVSVSGNKIKDFNVTCVHGNYHLLLSNESSYH